MSKVLAGLTTVLVVSAVAVAIGSLVLNILIFTRVNTIRGNTKPPEPFHFQPPGQCNSTVGTVSNTAAYKEAANFLLDGLDDTVDPCTDFYAFSCNNFLNKAVIPDGGSRIGTYDQSQAIVYSNIVDLLAKIDVNDKQYSQTERITKAAYDTCFNNIFASANKADLLYTEIKNLFGGAPFLKDPLKNNINYFDVAGQIEQQHAVGTLMSSIVSVDYKKVLQNGLYVSQPALALPRDYYVKPQYTDMLNGHVDDIYSVLYAFTNALGKKPDNATILEAAREVANFEVQIAMASWPDDLLRNYQQQYNPYMVNDAVTAYGAIDWKAYLNQLLAGVGVDQTKFQLILSQPSYFAWLNSVFNGKTVNTTVIANYMITQLVFDESLFLGPDMNNAAKEADYVQYHYRRGRGVTRLGRRYTRPRFDALDEAASTCLDILTGYMPYGTGYIYVKSRQNRTAVQSDIKDQTTRIIDSFQEMIGTLTWMDDDSKNAARNKSDSLAKNFGWPEKLFGDFKDTTVLDAYNQDYAGILDIYNKDKNNLYDVMGVLKKALEVREFFRLLNEPADRYNFLASPATVNAWYQPERNSITFPYAAWNPPYYNFFYPQAYNYAGQGGTGGHELTHGFDDEGVQFGWNGELTNCAWNKCGWMDDSSSSGFTDMAQCVVTQFSTQCCPEKKGNVHCANGATTQGENIADLGGQQAAYRAYRKYVDKLGHEEDRLPGMENYTPNQIFWITYGYSWCMKQTDENLVHQLLTNPHAPGSCRVNQVMQDIPEFGRDFGCARGTPMFPAPGDRCKVWVGV